MILQIVRHSDELLSLYLSVVEIPTISWKSILIFNNLIALLTNSNPLTAFTADRNPRRLVAVWTHYEQIGYMHRRFKLYDAWGHGSSAGLNLALVLLAQCNALDNGSALFG
jgi:hypothetical protein